MTTITPIMERYILHWGEMGTRWGVNRTISQIHALLYLSEDPLNAEEISALLSVARSNVSNSLKELQSLGLVEITHRLGDRRDYFTAKHDTWEMLLTIVEGRKAREIDPTLSMLRQCVLEMEDDKETPEVTRARIEQMLQFMTTMTDWYDQVKTLSRPTLITLMKMGKTVGSLLPKGKVVSTKGRKRTGS